MSKTITLRVDDEAYELFRAAAEAERRPLSNLIETAALARIREQQFVDEDETAEILANENLMKRLKRGWRDARTGKGKLVE